MGSTNAPAPAAGLPAWHGLCVHFGTPALPRSDRALPAAPGLHREEAGAMEQQIWALPAGREPVCGPAEPRAPLKAGSVRVHQAKRDPSSTSLRPRRRVDRRRRWGV
jgi:hypothetical protein